jgi:hypothetical protein
LNFGCEDPDRERGREPRVNAVSDCSKELKGGLGCEPSGAVAIGGSLDKSCRGVGSGEIGGPGERASGCKEDEASSEYPQRV